MKIKLTILLLLSMTGMAGIQVRAQNIADTVDVGIVEHLDGILPSGLTFRDESNRQVVLKDLIKHPTILTLIYFDCPGICPQILASVANVVRKLDMQLGKDYQVVTVSFNDQDTPEKAMDKKNAFLDSKSKPYAEYWTYLTGDSANIHALTNGVGYKFIRAGNDFIHPTCIIILSPEGKITRYLYGTTYLPFDVKMALIEAQKGLSRPTINRVLDFCFSYDPAGRRYTLEITKVSGVIILFASLVLLISLLIHSSRKRLKAKTKNESTNPQ
jgi:protein SCO1